ncbi:hypothetical protein [Pseudomonas sp. BMS12]|uniref:hypothetical protein n=1 Tax=Pseudomonas sp. BMS12 TaxID=1796033 RepID=UPI00083B8552|nr:hypothetical protein [Pseudomonas sp. BMS12]
MIELQLTAGALLVLVMLYRHYAKRRAARHSEALRQALMHCLEVLQRLQKHRGLGGQRTPEARQQCRLQAQELDGLWRSPPPAADELKELLPAWQSLRSEPSDFDGHCRLIDRLLTLIQVLEMRLTEDVDIAHGCRELEDLGRLRGLAVRGANEQRCPLPLQIQLRYLSQRLQGRCARSSALAMALERLRLQLIEPLQVAINPADCYALLTPLIDEQLGQLRQRLIANTRSAMAKDLLEPGTTQMSRTV